MRQAGACCGFQFHKGAIKTGGAGAADSSHAGFNSIKVRLRQVN